MYQCHQINKLQKEDNGIIIRGRKTLKVLNMVEHKSIHPKIAYVGIRNSFSLAAPVAVKLVW